MTNYAPQSIGMDLLSIDFHGTDEINLENDEEMVREIFETVVEAVASNAGDKGEAKYAFGINNNQNQSMTFGAA